MRQVVALTGDPASWVTLGNLLSRARRHAEAIQALRQGLWLHRRAGAQGRARTVARLILSIAPEDPEAIRLACLGAQH